MTGHSFELPEPPSTNALWKPVRSRFVKSPRYKQWKLDADWHLIGQDRPRDPITGQLNVRIEAHDQTKLDLDNCCKALLDALQDARIISNDRDVHKLTVLRSATQRKGYCTVTVV